MDQRRLREYHPRGIPVRARLQFQPRLRGAQVSAVVCSLEVSGEGSEIIAISAAAFLSPFLLTKFWRLKMGAYSVRQITTQLSGSAIYCQA